MPTTKFNLVEILEKYEYSRKKALAAAKIQLQELNFSKKRMALISSIISTYFDLKEEEREEGAVTKRRLLHSDCAVDPNFEITYSS